MRRAAIPLLGYALVIAVAAAVQWVWSPHRLPAALLSGAALVMAVIAAGVVLGGRREEARDAGDGEAGGAGLRPIPDSSFSMVAIAFALCTMLVGAYLGLYLILVGAGVLVLGAGGLVREMRAERRALRRAGEGGDGG